MKLIIDGMTVIARPEQSLLDIVRELGLLKGKLSTDPIAAKISGRVFTLNYIPVREKDVKIRESMRKAMAASGGVIRLIRYSDHAGRDAYTKTAQFVMFLAIKRLWPAAHAKMNCTVGSGLYVKVSGAENFSAEVLKKEIERIVAENITLRRRRVATADAIEYFKSTGEDDKARLLGYRKKERIDLYESDNFADYYYGEMAPSTEFLRSWDIIPAPEGFIFIFPDVKNPDKVADYKDMPNFFGVYTEGKRWGNNNL